MHEFGSFENDGKLWLQLPVDAGNICVCESIPNNSNANVNPKVLLTWLVFKKKVTLNRSDKTVSIACREQLLMPNFSTEYWHVQTKTFRRHLNNTAPSHVFVIAIFYMLYDDKYLIFFSSRLERRL